MSETRSDKPESELVRFARLVQTMRGHQVAYFRQRGAAPPRANGTGANSKVTQPFAAGGDRGAVALVVAKAAENAVDNAVKWILEHRVNTNGHGNGHASEDASQGGLFPAMGVATPSRVGAYPVAAAREPPPVEDDGSEIPHVSEG